MRHAGRVYKHVAHADGREAVGRPHVAGAGADDEQFPLSEVEVMRSNGCAGRESADLEVKRMPDAPRAGIAQAADGNRDFAAVRLEFLGGRVLLLPRNRIEVEVVHKKSGAK